MKVKLWALPVLVLSVLFTSCFNNLKNPKETSVSFYMDEATVSKILKTNFNARSASDIIDSQQTYIDVTLCGDNEQTQTELLSKQVQMEFKDVFVGSRVYAKAQIYKYEDSEKSVKNIYYRGESSKITVREGKNVLSIKLGPATLTVTFDSNGGSEVPSQLVLTGSAATEPEKPVKPADKKKYSKDNFAFAGWFTDAELTKEYNFELPVKDDLTLYAKWLPDFVFVEGATVNDYLVTGRNIKISDLFVSDHEVTQAEYLAVTNENPSNNKKTDEKANEYPVENVTWLEAIKYCNKLSENEGLDPCYKIDGSEVTCTLSANGYRLPTEAEWEYISTKSNRTNIDFDSMALYSSNSQNQTWEVDNRRADELGLCNVLGNVAEWCFDIYSDTVTKSTGPTGPMATTGAGRVVRGGSFQSSAAECTPQTRACADPAEKSAAIGFRVVRTVVYEFKIAKNTVTFEPNGGSAVDIQIVVQGDCATQPSNPTRTGYNFQGWKYAGDDFDFSTPVTQDIVLEADWTPIEYTISYDLDGGTIATANPTTYTIETETFELNNPTKTLWNFKGWYNGTQKVTKIEKGSYGNLNLVASWTQCHIVSFETNGGSTVEQQEVENNSYATLPSAEPTKTGYDFVRWYTTNQNTAFNFEGTQITGNLTIYALWSPHEYTITYNTVEGTNDSSNPAVYTIETATFTLADQSRNGYDFDGWVDQGNNPITQITLGSTGDISLTATWSLHEYTITYNNIADCTWLSGYTAPATFTINDTGTITLPVAAQIQKTGYTFDGWYDGWDAANNTVSGNQIESFSPQTQFADVVVYAKWTIITYNITYDTDGGTNPSNAPTYTITSNAITLSPSTKVGFEFMGWKNTATGASIATGTIIDEIPTGSYGDLTLVAQWQEETQATGIEVTFGIPSGDINVNPVDSGTNRTFTADEGYTNYKWEFDDTVVVTERVYTLDTSSITQPGWYTLVLTATKNSILYSWTMQIQKQ